MTVLPFRPNQRTYERQRRARAKERERLIAKIGIRAEDAPLYDEYLSFMVYQAMRDTRR
jgi:hypothetical protein